VIVTYRLHELVLAIYRPRANAFGRRAEFPADERFGPIAQLRRAAVTVPANTAEGSKRRTNADYAHFLNIAEASLAETEYLLILGRDLGYTTAVQLEPLFASIAEIARMLHALRTKVEQSP